MSDDERVADILADWYDRREQGEAQDPSDVVRGHPDVADTLEAHFAAQAMFDQIAGRRAPSSHAAPATLGEFHVLREIGRGGMGVVYEAEQTTMRRRVALKVLYPSVTSNPRSVERFQREARAAGRLHHTNIVPVHSMGEEKGVWFYAMELVEGRPLDQVIKDVRRFARSPRKERAPDVATSGFGTNAGTRGHYERVALAFAGVAEGLDAAHAVSIVHRDVKPSNLVLDTEGTLRLMDFGLARVADEAAATRTGELMGTPAYMSPEQIMGVAASVDRRTDVYSLGATLYEALTLRAPFQGATVPQVFAHIVSKGPRAPRRLDPRIPRDLETIVQKAMEKDPARRYATAGEMAYDLRLFSADAAIRARRVGAVERAWRTVKRHRAVSALTGAILVLGVGTAILGVRGEREADRSRLFEYDRAVETANQELAHGQTLAAAQELRQLPYHRALGLFGRAIALDPSRGDAWFGRALSVWVGVLDDRLDDLDAARARGLPERTYRLARAFVLWRNGQFDEAEGEERLAGSSSGPSSPTDAYLRGRLLAARHRDSEAVQSLSDAIRGSPLGSMQWTRALLERSRIEERLGNVHRAFEDVAEARGGGGVTWPDLQVRLAGLWKRIGKPDQAEDLFQRALRDVAEADDLSQWCDLCAAASSDPAWYERATAEAVRRHGADGDLVRRRAEALVGIGRIRDGLQVLEDYLKRSPADVEGWAEKGALLEITGDRPGARRALETAVALDGACANARNDLGVLLLADGDVEAAASQLRETVRLAPNYALARFNLGVALEKQDPDGAAAAYRGAIRIAPEFAAAHVNLIGLLTRKEDLGAAIAAGQAAMESVPDVSAVRCNFGRALMLHGDLEAALVELAEAVRLDEKNAAAHYMRGQALMRKKEYGQALSCFEAALAIDENDADTHLEIGNARDALGDRPEALAAFRTAIEKREDFGEAFYNLGNVLVEEKNLLGARDAYREAARLLPKAARVQNDYGWALLNTNDPEGARQAFLTAIALDPRYAFAHSNMAATLEQMNLFAEALPYYRLAIELSGEDAPNRRRCEERYTKCERWLALDREIDAIDGGAARPTDAGELAGLSDLCYRKHRYEAAADLMAAAFAASPTFAEDVEAGHRYNGACDAALAGVGRGKDAVPLGEEGRARLRRQALEWLRADLALWTAKIRTGGATASKTVASALRHWLEDTDLAGIRDEAALKDLSDPERRACSDLWRDVASILKRADSSVESAPK